MPGWRPVYWMLVVNVVVSVLVAVASLHRRDSVCSPCEARLALGAGSEAAVADYAVGAVLPVLVVYPAVFAQARTVLGLLHAENRERAVVVVPYDLPDGMLAELVVIRRVVLLTVEKLASRTLDPVLAQLDGLAEAARMLPGQPLLLVTLHDKVFLSWMVLAKKGFSSVAFAALPSNDSTPGHYHNNNLVALGLGANQQARRALADFASAPQTQACVLRQFDDPLPPDCVARSASFLSSFVSSKPNNLVEPMELLKFNKPNCYTTHVLHSPGLSNLKPLPSALRKRSICIVTPTLSSQPWSSHPLFTHLFRAIVETVSHPSKFVFRVYIVFETGDAGFESWSSLAEFQALANRTLASRWPSASLITLRAPKVDGDVNYLWNLGFLRAYDDGCEYLYHLVDDATLRNQRWDEVFVDALASARPLGNLGLVGTAYELVSMPFVHRSHLAATRGKFYPSQTHNWFGDTVVYQAYRDSKRLVGPRLYFDNDSDLNKKGARRYDVCDVAHQPLVDAMRAQLDAFETSHLGPQPLGPMEWLAGSKQVSVNKGLHH